MITLPQRILVALIACLTTPVSLALGAAQVPEAAAATTVSAITTVEPLRISRVAALRTGADHVFAGLSIRRSRAAGDGPSSKNRDGRALRAASSSSR
jgi:hypothetical protein